MKIPLINPKKKSKKVLVFGTFDALHPGHLAFLRQAHELGQIVSVCLARNKTIQQLKGQPPEQTFRQRRQALRRLDTVHRVYKGDANLGNYRVINKVQPDIIALGYDQGELQQDLTSWLDKHGKGIKIVTLAAFKPHKFKSSLRRK